MATLKTGWLKKTIDGVSTKIFAKAHVKSTYYNYTDGIMLDDVLVETEDFDQTAVTESDISPVILSKINAVDTAQANNYALLNANKADAANTYTKPEVDNLVSTGGHLTFSNVTVATTAFVEDTTYTDYPYKADIACEGVTASHIPEVNFSLEDATSGNYATFALSGEGVVTIYAKEIPASDLTIPSILCVKGE